MTNDEFNATAIEEALKINNTLIYDIQEQLLTANMTNMTNNLSTAAEPVEEKPSLIQKSKKKNETANATAAVTTTKEPGPYGNATSVNSTINEDYKMAMTVKTLIYGLGKDEILLRVMNMEDNFDADAKTHMFDVNAWARDFYMEANQHLLVGLEGSNSSMLIAGMRVDITEMNLSGSIEKAALLTGNFTHGRHGGQNKTNSTTELTNWKVNKAEDPVNVTRSRDFIQEVSIPRIKGNPESDEDKKPLKEKNYIINLDPQVIRAFAIKYWPSERDPLKELLQEKNKPKQTQ